MTTNDTFLALLLAPAAVAAPVAAKPTKTADPLAAGYSYDGKPATVEMIEMLAELKAFNASFAVKPAATFGAADAGVIYGGDMEDVF